MDVVVAVVQILLTVMLGLCLMHSIKERNELAEELDRSREQLIMARIEMREPYPITQQMFFSNASRGMPMYITPMDVEMAERMKELVKRVQSL